MSETKKLLESIQNNLKEADNINNQKIIYMNTWANYNENGADLSKYGISEGWLTVDEAIEFAQKYSEDEPFINDIDIELPFKVDEYSDLSILEDIKKYINLDNNEKEILDAIIEASGDSFEEALNIYESDNYYYIPDINNESDLGYQIIDIFYNNDIPEDLVERYFDYEKLGRDLDFDEYETEDEEGNINYISAGEYFLGDENASDYDIGQAYIEEVGISGISNVDNYFDYEGFGRDLTFENWTLTKNGAIELY